MQQEQRRPKQSQHQRTVSFAEVNCLRGVVGRGWWTGEFVASELEGSSCMAQANPRMPLQRGQREHVGCKHHW